MARIYVGNLPMDVTEREVDDLFYKFGRIRSIEIKTPSRPPAFAFVVRYSDNACNNIFCCCVDYYASSRLSRIAAMPRTPSMTETAIASTARGCAWRWRRTTAAGATGNVTTGSPSAPLTASP